MVRPHIEFANSVWSPYHQKDTVKLEKVQRRATKIGCLSHLSYEDRLIKLKLTSLTERRLRGDLIQTFKFIKGIDKSNMCIVKPTAQRYSQRLYNNFHFNREKVTKSTPRHHFLPNRTAEVWSSLPQSIVDSTNVNQFKNRLDNYLKVKH